MIAAELLRRVHATGADLRLGGPTGVELVHYSRVNTEMVETIRLHRDAIRVLLEQNATTVNDAVMAAQRLLRECRWLETSRDDCAFRVGYSGEDCKRCGASVGEHY